MPINRGGPIGAVSTIGTDTTIGGGPLGGETNTDAVPSVWIFATGVLSAEGRVTPAGVIPA